MHYVIISEGSFLFMPTYTTLKTELSGIGPGSIAALHFIPHIQLTLCALISHGSPKCAIERERVKGTGGHFTAGLQYSHSCRADMSTPASPAAVPPSVLHSCASPVSCPSPINHPLLLYCFCPFTSTLTT